MLFTDDEAPQLKVWIVKRLENTSDADADVLADYVLALLRHDGDIQTVRELCEAEIPDFLKEDSAIFIKDLFDTVLYKRYLQGGGIPSPQNAPQQMPAFAPPTGPSAQFTNNMPVGVPTGPGGARKRGFDDRGDSEATLGRDINGGGYKAQRREQAPQGHYDSFGKFHQGPTHAPMPPMPPMPPGMQLPPGIPPFDPQNPMAAFMALQEAMQGMPGMPGMAGFPPNGPQAPQDMRSNNLGPKGRRGRCRDYDTKGFCARGNSCKYEHGQDSIYVHPGANDEYDPTNASLMLRQQRGSSPIRQQTPQRFGPGPLPSQERGRGRGGRGGFSDRGGMNGGSRGGRPDFADSRPNYDRSRTTIVVESIPEEDYEEQQIRDFFNQYGNVSDVTMRPDTGKRVAMIKFADFDSAQAAYKSPKVVFDNRFVKVFWYRDESQIAQIEPLSATRSRRGSKEGVERPPIDMEEFALKQAEAQAAHEEKAKKMAEVEEQRAAMQKQAEELLKKQAEEKKKLMERLAAMEAKAKGNGTADANNSKSEAELLREKMLALEAETRRLGQAASHQDDAQSFRGRGRGGYRGRGAYTPRVNIWSPHASQPTSTTNAPTADGEKPSSQADVLKAQLAALEEEAASLGIDPNNAEDHVGAWPARGRGRGGFRGRGAFPPRGRGAFKGRGGVTTGANAYRLDNRPKTVAVSGADFGDSAKDESLRQFLLGVGEFTVLENKGNKTEVTFNDRFTAEKFMYGVPNNELPGVGKVELAWVQKPLPPVTLPHPADHMDSSSSPAKDNDTHMEGDAMAHDAGGDNTGNHGHHDAADNDGGDLDWA